MTWPVILIDEDFPREVGRRLRGRADAEGVTFTADSEWAGSSDDEQVERAAALRGVLLSHNRHERLRFHTCVQKYRGRGDGRVCVLLLPRDASDDRLYLRAALLLDWYMLLEEPKPATLIWNDAQQALLRGWHPDGYADADLMMVVGQSAV